MENKHGMTERVRRLREESLNTQPTLSIERALLMTEAYQLYEGKVSTPVLRALAFKHVLANKTIAIGEGELIVGERGPGPQAAPTYPELCCHSLEDFDVIDARDKIRFAVGAEAKRAQKEAVIPYWQGRSMRDHLFAQMTEEWKDCYLAGIFTEFMEQRAPGHTVCDDKIYKKGMLDFKREIAGQLEGLDFLHDLDAYAKQEELRAMDIACDALILFAGRFAREAERLHDLEPDPVRRGELKQIAAVCRRVPAQAPRTFHEALQMYWFVHLGVITELNTWDAYCPGHLDQHLYPYYARKHKAGTLSRDRAKELLECFWIKFNNQPAPPKVGITLKESSTYTDFCNINIGGLKMDGSDGANEVSSLLFDVIKEMRLLQPSTNVQISQASADDFVLAAADVISLGMGFPSVFNADMVVKELVRQGKSTEDARCGGTSGCVEAGAFGKEAYILTGYFNMVKVLEITLNNGVDPETGKQLGPKTGDPGGFETMEALFDAYRAQLEHFINVDIRGNHVIEALYAEKMPAPFLSVLTDDCIVNARDYNAGGARYNSRYIQFVGLGSLTDCLSSINTHVYRDRRYSLPDLLTMLSRNFEGYEKERLHLWNKTPKYGNDIREADRFAGEVVETLFQLVDGRPTPTGGTYRIEMLPTTCHVYFGSVVGATPDGRKAHDTLSEGISPVQGADRNGPTSVLKSASSFDHSLTGGALLNQKFSPTVISGEKGLNSLKDLIRTYFALGGHHIQFNIIDDQVLRDAQARPEQYGDLIVRVAGYSDYFNNLTRELQDEIITRTAQRGG